MEGENLDLKDVLLNDGNREAKMRIIQELVPGKQITLAHIIANPDPVLYQKLGLDPSVDYSKSAIGIIGAVSMAVMEKPHPMRWNFPLHRMRRETSCFSTLIFIIGPLCGIPCGREIL